MSIDKKSSKPLYEQIKEYISNGIHQGHYQPYQKISSEWGLASKFGVSRLTVRKAFDDLVNRGILYREHGKGTFVEAPGNLKRSSFIKSKPSVGFLSSRIGDKSVIPQILMGIEEVLYQNGFQVIFSHSESKRPTEAEKIAALWEDGAEGIIFCSADSAPGPRSLCTALPDRFPLVVVGAPIGEDNVHSVTCDHFSGGYRITKHLIGHGYRKIGFFAPPHRGLFAIHERFRGYVRALEDHGMARNDCLIENRVDVEAPEDSILHAGRYLDRIKNFLEKNKDLEAVFVYSDRLARTFYAACADLHIGIPQDLAIAAFEDIGVSYLTPALTTARQDFRQIGKASSELLLDAMGHKGEALARHVSVPVELTPRASCGWLACAFSEEAEKTFPSVTGQEEREALFRLLRRNDLRVNSNGNVVLTNDGLGKYGIFYYNGRFPHGGGLSFFHSVQWAFYDRPDSGPLPLKDWKTIWRPDFMENGYQVQDKVAVDEVVFTEGNSATFVLRLKNLGDEPLSLTLVVHGSGMKYPHLASKSPYIYEDATRKISDSVTAQREFGRVEAGRILIEEREGLYADTKLVFGPLDTAFVDDQPIPAESLWSDHSETNTTAYGDPVFYGGARSIDLEPGAVRTVVLTAVFGEEEAALREAWEDSVQQPAAALSRIKDALGEYFQAIPAVDCPREYRALFYHAFWKMKHNMYTFPGAMISRPYIAPAKAGQDGLWLEVTASTLLVLRWLRDPSLVYDQIENLKDMQLSDGAIPLQVPPKGITVYDAPLGQGDLGRTLSKSLCEERAGAYEMISHTPVLSLTIWGAFLVTGDRGLLERSYASLERFSRWWLEQRDRDGDHLSSIKHPYEAGRNDDKDLWEWSHEELESIDLACHQVNDQRVLSRMAHILGDERGADSHSALAEIMEAALDRTMWDEDTGFYYTVAAESHRKVMVRTAVGLLPLFTNSLSEEKAARLVAHLTDPGGFWAHYPVSSLCLSDPDFGKGRGRDVVVLHNWLIIQGLLKNGYEKIAAELVQKTLALPFAGAEKPIVDRCYDAEKGVLRGEPQSLSEGSLLVDMMIRWIYGMQPRADEVLEFDPLVLRYGLLDWDRASIEGIRYHSLELGIYWDKVDGYRVTRNGRLLFQATKPIRIVIDEGEQIGITIQGEAAIRFPQFKGALYGRGDGDWDRLSVGEEGVTISEEASKNYQVFKVDA
ncbi:MAG: substrate-binding domain-containing protein [Candidatus Latescibacteria bacterium]|nr:substrate-binding domain-containing protein [Candidatus Latescibacterota bacterium]